MGRLPNLTQAPLLGLVKVIQLERPELQCKLIDIDDNLDAQMAASKLVEQFRQNNPENQRVFYEGKYYVPRIQQCVLEKSNSVASFCPSTEGTYLITGGLGGLGLVVAQWLVEKGAKHLVLVGRRPASPAVQPLLEELRGKGATITTLQANVAQADEVEKVLHTIRQEMPPLKGVIHAAGIDDREALVKQNWSRFEKVMAFT
jgi:hypothetical protein